MNNNTAVVTTDDEAGLGLIEIVVAMFVLAALSLCLLPLLINGTQQSAKTAAIASASQLVNNQIVAARDTADTCTAVAGVASVPVGAASVYRGVPLSLTKTMGTCPNPAPTATAPSTVTYTVTVTRTDTGATLATATTRILVTGS
ncbi:MAG: hypothetical protein JWN80_2342 [Microbacteriaceae bacterium]|jgi:type II secretory pathway pseudopilin PulG|nr:hypothetical protein [Microbacteriaceae bacterium]